MTALTSDRGTTRRGGSFPIPVKANVHIRAGAWVVFDAGYAAPARSAEDLVSAGVALEEADNTGGADSDISCLVDGDTHARFENAAGDDAVAQANVGSQVYPMDDQTVTKTAAGRSAAVKCVGLDNDGVWVEFS